MAIQGLGNSQYNLGNLTSASSNNTSSTNEQPPSESTIEATITLDTNSSSESRISEINIGANLLAAQIKNSI